MTGKTGGVTESGSGRTAADAAAALVEERWRPVHRYGAFVLLGVGFVLSVATADAVGMDRTDWYVLLALSAAALVLQLWWVRAERTRPGPSAAGVFCYWVRWALAFVLTWINPFFAFFAAVGYFDADRLLPPLLRKPALFASVVVVAGSQSGGLPPRDPLGWIVFGALIAVNMTLVGAMGHLQAKEDEHARVQARTIRELAEANTALQQALDENAALHDQLLVQAREAGVADERRRLAAEIHDTIAQGLTGIIAQLQVVANTDDRALARVHLGRAADLARSSLGEARRSVHNLGPAALQDQGLAEALKQTVAEWSARTGVRAEFTVTGTAEPLHDEIEGTLVRIAQEALSNTARHAAATRIGVTLSYMDDEVALDVRDDGAGFDPLTIPQRSGSGGFGVDGMRARAERVAGAVEIESEPGLGTAVSARVPLVRKDVAGTDRAAGPVPWGHHDQH
ncbi:sensor histidine kinase [Streptomyces sp. YC504]|uniref:Sensor histidine kinase n=1 Tax=Streptomyces mesophilus TaxID=1775132 RepID=A0A6G4XIP0_9ACTN|nr:sensor histidine kinase [Streptomyces mesophilus]NGO76710.1 sensor histidine kinase [Streptomyces mesophilus]